MAAKREFTFDSSDGRTRIHAVEWRPESGRAVAVLQIFHGMLEFIERYEPFAEFLTEKGFVVVGNDHLGHGTSIVSKEDYGFFAEEDGNQHLLADVHKLRLLTSEQYPKLPYYILGHSMGSFLLRQYLCIHGQGLAGAVIMGTGSKDRLTLGMGKLLCKGLARMKGWHYRSRLIDRMAFGSYNQRFRPARTKADWLTKDEKIVDWYLQEERCTFLFTVNGYYNLFVSLEEASKESNLQKMPKDLPVFFIAGKDDPVGDFGSGVEKVRKSFESVGMKDVTWMLYETDRHEILNELDRENVYKDIYAWLYVRMQDSQKERSK